LDHCRQREGFGSAIAEGALPTKWGVVRVRHEKRPDGSIATKIDAPPGVKITDGK